MHKYTHIKYIISNNIRNPDAKSKVFYPPSYILSNSTISYHLPFSLFLLIRRLESSSSSSYMFSIVNEKRDFCFVILAENGNNVYRVFISHTCDNLPKNICEHTLYYLQFFFLIFLFLFLFVGRFL